MKTMKHARLPALLATLFLFAPTAWADLSPYGQDFEGLDMADPAALGNDGWLGFANVFDAAGNFLYGYGPFPAPNGGAGFSAIVSGEGGPDQGAQQLSVYSDYNNADHACCVIEANVFQEQIIGAADLGTEWTFSFEAKKGNIELGTTAFAFIKVLDLVGGTFNLLAFPTIDVTNTPNNWTPYEITLAIDPAWEGQLVQFGALSYATNFEGSGIFYDNISFAPAAVPSIGGAVEGEIVFQARCINEATGQAVPIGVGGAMSWDCTAAGLVANSGDSVLQVGIGLANGSVPVAGGMTGLSGVFGLCRNFVTGQTVVVPLAGATSWDCTAAGFLAAPGEVVIQVSRGVVP